MLAHPGQVSIQPALQVVGQEDVGGSGAVAVLRAVETVPVAGVVEIHEMSMEGNVMKMRELEKGLEIPAGATVTLKPKSLHIMFMDVKQQPGEGASFTGTLTFEKAGDVTIEAVVDNARKPDAAGMMDHGAHGAHGATVSFADEAGFVQAFVETGLRPDLASLGPAARQAVMHLEPGQVASDFAALLGALSHWREAA